MNDTPPSFVCFSSDYQENDDCSELTWTCSGDETSQKKCVLARLIALKQNADPNYYNKLDGTHPTQMHRPRSLPLLDPFLTDTDTVPLEEKQRQELVRLKLQIAKQQEKLDILSSKLSQCQVENEVLKAEKAVLVDEQALAIQEQPITRQGWFSKGANNKGDSMQSLVDTNAKLVMDNARLQVVVDVTRRSFQSYIKDSRRGSGKDKQTIKALRKLSLSQRTGDTSLGSLFTEENQEDLLPVDSSQHSIRDSMPTKSLHSISEQEFSFGDVWIVEGEEMEATNSSAICNKAARRHSTPVPRMELENTFFKPKRATRRKSEQLLVDFGETRRSRSNARR